MTGRGLGGLATLVFFAALTGRTTAADELAQPGGGPGSEAREAESGKALYAQHCSHCHGFDMVNPGNVVPDLREFPADKKQRFADTVTHG